MYTDASSATRTVARHNHVNFAWKYVRKLVEIKCALMRNDRIWTGLQPSSEKIFVWRAGELYQPIYFTLNARESSGGYIIRKTFPRKPDFLDFVCCKVTCLVFIDLV